MTATCLLATDPDSQIQEQKNLPAGTRETLRVPLFNANGDVCAEESTLAEATYTSNGER